MLKFALFTLFYSAFSYGDIIPFASQEEVRPRIQGFISGDRLEISVDVKIRGKIELVRDCKFKDVKEFFKTLHQKIDLEGALQPQHYMACLLHPFYKRMRSALYLAPGTQKPVSLFKEEDVTTAEGYIRNEIAKMPSPEAAMTSQQGNARVFFQDEEQAKDELRLYLAEYYNVDADINVMQFWKGNEDRFPQLASIARRVFCVPASSSEVERMFSCLRNLVDEKRTLLDKDLTAKLLVGRRLD
ncbi:unnamed protein product [Bursaphelenchus xylophilus]|uniref:(pine wood nematode) hypothetical protein n=1 Tax=Bursaphelenchus xylophilus TaxID=6326 RepID=A0A7I8X539_BURXY|nr:unnamed protein product [Bursaphelenchus xylophilus]CAG9122081.1 unnamed protein product [Bursaphelenchus xylophilus]